MHGTAVAGIVGASSPQITGIGPDVMIYLDKVLATNAYLTGTDFDGARALQLAVEDGADVANISWGVGPAGNGQSREARAVDAAWALGMTVVKSAGNQGPWLRTLTSPADASGVIVVGATDVGGIGVQAYSSHGPLPNGEHQPQASALDRPIEVVVELAPTAPVSAPSPRSRADRRALTSRLRTKFDARVARLGPALEAAGATVHETTWLNDSLVVVAPASSLGDLAKINGIELMDVAAPLTPD